MKNKIFTFLLAICLMLPCAFMLTACSQEEPTFNGYKVYINGTQTDEFSCTSGETAITAQNISVKSDWSDKSKNTEFSLDDFDISVEWEDRWGAQQTSFPNFWTNGTGNTASDFATTYEFTLTLKSDSVWQATFSVKILPIMVSNCRVRIFDGTQYTYSAEIVYGYNDRESDPTKQLRIDVENLDAGYDQQEHMQWALIKKETYDALETPEQKKAYFDGEWRFGSVSGVIDSNIAPGTYYAFAYVPDWNNHHYGLYGDGIIYDYAVLTIKPIGLTQTPETHVLQHDEYKTTDFTYSAFDTNSEITANIDCDYSQYIYTQPYAYVNGSWTILDKRESDGNGGTKEKSIKVHAVLTADGYKLVDLKDLETSLYDWVFINDDGSQGADVTDNSAIVLIDYKELEQYKTCANNKIYIIIPTYYMVVDNSSSLNVYFNCSQLYRTEVKIWKKDIGAVPNVDVGDSQYVTAPNTFEFTYGDPVDIEQIMQNALWVYSYYSYYFVGFDQTEPSDQPYYGYVTLNSPHFAWRLDGVNFTSDPLVITYYIHPAE